MAAIHLTGYHDSNENENDCSNDKYNMRNMSTYDKVGDAINEIDTIDDNDCSNDKEYRNQNSHDNIRDTMEDTRRENVNKLLLRLMYRHRDNNTNKGNLQGFV